MAKKYEGDDAHVGVPSAPMALPLDGYSNWNLHGRFVPFSRETARKLELRGKFPPRVQLGSSRSVGRSNRELHRWFTDPAGYRAPEAA